MNSLSGHSKMQSFTFSLKKKVRKKKIIKFFKISVFVHTKSDQGKTRYHFENLINTTPTHDGIDPIFSSYKTKQIFIIK